jgi:hypothetical protein
MLKSRSRAPLPLTCRAPRNLLCLAVYLLLCCLPGLAQSQQVRSIENALTGLPAISLLLAQEMPGQNGQQSSGTIGGTVVDQNGNAVVSARVTLSHDGQTEEQQAVSDTNGHFFFPDVTPGPFQLTVNAEGFAAQTEPGTLPAGEPFEMPDISLSVAPTTTDVRVGSATKSELAEVQIKVEEKQRVLGFIPNFYVSYDRNPLSLTAKQKFELAWKSSVDPFSFAISGAIAGAEQAENEFSAYGQGAQGYAKRYGASYSNGFIGTMVGGAILPSLFKQDPRYFYKGTGTTRSRIWYALANAVICKGDNGRWQANYSGILGSLAAGGISNLYYPANDRNGVALTFENTLIGIASTGAANLFQEFLVRRLTPHASDPQSIKP